VLGATWAFDTGAYFVGSRFGRTKLMPWISPGKTWEGAAGGLLLTLVVVWLASVDLAGFVPGLTAIDWRPLPIPVLHIVPMALGIAIAAVLGDLAESMVKRDAGAKDASGFFPGHGGMFDRIDSVLFTAPFVYYYAGALLGTAG
jgi:phosphatidate cytidylyltransferase